MKKVNLTLAAFLLDGAALFTGWEKRERTTIKPPSAVKIRQQFRENMGFEELCLRLDTMLKPLPQK